VWKRARIELLPQAYKLVPNVARASEILQDALLKSAAVVDEARAELMAAKDEVGVRVLEVIGDDVLKPSEIAAATALPIDAVENARKRIRRVYAKVIARRIPEAP
jgi:DNA-directed RNA polymerase specialized sigma24 family protein